MVGGVSLSLLLPSCRNAKLYAPGLYRKDEDVETDAFLGQRVEVKKHGRVRGGWMGVMRAVSRN